MEPAKPARIRHVWVRPAMGSGPPKQGLVLAWRLVPQRTSPPSWQAFVVHVDDRYGTVQAEWIWALYLVPAVTEPP